MPTACCSASAEEIRQDGGLRAMMMTFLTSDWFRRGRGEAP